MKWLWRLLLLAFDRDFRQRHGAEVLAAIEAERVEPRYLGPMGTVRHVCHVVVDVLAAAGRRRLVRPRADEHSGNGMIDNIRQDLRYAVRQLIRRPGFAAVAVVSLALGIGVNTAVFGIVDSFVLHPFEFPDADRLLIVGPSFPKMSNDVRFIEVLSPLEYEDIRRAPSFARAFAFDLGNRNISGGDVPDRVFTAFMLDDAFPVIGLRPLIGRGFTREELAPNGPPAAILSHRLWMSRFHADPAIVGATVRVNGVATTVVGVMPPQLLLVGTDLWMPWGARPDRMPRNMRQFSVVGRLASGRSRRTLDAELTTIAARVAADHAREFPEYTGWRLVARPLAAGVLESVRPAGFLVLGAVALVLLIACANLASLMLARASGREREFAVRVALGAAGGRLAQQLLTEIALLAGAGGAAGFAIAAAAVRASNALVPAQIATFGLGATLNARVALWCVLSTGAAIVLVGLLPALQSGRTDPNGALKRDSRQTGGGPGAGRIRRTLVVVEVVLAVMLALGAGLLLRSFVNLLRVDTGVESARVITMRLTLPQEKYRTRAAIAAFFEELAARVETIPGVRRAALTSQFPPQEFFRTRVLVDGSPGVADGTTLPTAYTTVVSRGYFEALRIALRAGRPFDERDRAGSAPVVVVNQAFATRYLSGRTPLGARIRTGNKPEQAAPAEIVGVVADTANVGAAAPPMPEVFVPMEQGREDWNQLFLTAKVESDPMAAVPAIRQAVVSIDPDQPVYAIQTLEQAFRTSLVPQQVSTILLGSFALVALVLAGVGIAGITAYAVRSRTQEIGIRMAMGATRGAVTWMVVRQVLLLVGAGLVAGVGAVASLGAVLSSVLFGVRPVDPVTIAATAALLGGVAVASAWWPASLASRVDPVVALRYD